MQESNYMLTMSIHLGRCFTRDDCSVFSSLAAGDIRKNY